MPKPRLDRDRGIFIVGIGVCFLGMYSLLVMKMSAVENRLRGGGFGQGSQTAEVPDWKAMERRIDLLEANIKALTAAGGAGAPSSVVAASASIKVASNEAAGGNIFFPPGPHDESTKEDNAFNVRVPQRVLPDGKVEPLSVAERLRYLELKTQVAHMSIYGNNH